MNPDPQTGGLFSFLNRMRKPNSATGLSPIQNFAQALDPLILPSMRGGEAIRQQGLQRVAQGSRNATVEFLKTKAAQGDKIAAQLIPAIENRSIPMKDAMSFYYNATFKPQKDTSAIQNYEYAKNVLGMSDEEARKFGGSSPLVNVGGTEKAWDKGVGELGVETLRKIQDDASGAIDVLNQAKILEALMADPNFQSGMLQEPIMQFKKIVATLGGDPANVESQEAFQAITAQLILDKMGGKLGAGFSEGDRKFVERMSLQLSTSIEGNKIILAINKAIAERKIQINQFATEYIKQNGMIDVNFSDALNNWAKANPMFEAIDPEIYF